MQRRRDRQTSRYKGNHQHGKHRKTNRDKAMVRTAFLGRYIPLRLSI